MQINPHLTLPTEESAISRDIEIPLGHTALEGHLDLPQHPVGVVLFAHGSGSSRFSPRNQQVARMLQAQELGTLLIDLLTPDEEQIDQRTRHLRFDIGLLAGRLRSAIDWMRGHRDLSGLKIGLFGASTGAAAAIVAAADRPDDVHAIVSRGGRPDLAGEALTRIHAPALLIVGGEDLEVLALNEAAQREINSPVDLAIIPGASHLFEERGALPQVARLAGAWFRQYLGRTGVRIVERSESPHA